jgi:hypothetical protein
VSIAAQPSRLCVPFSEKLDSLLTRLDNRRKMHGSQKDALEWRAGTKMTLITVAVRRFTGYKYLLHLGLITISQFFFLFHLGFTFLALHSINGRQERYQARSLSLQRGESISRQC